MGDEHQGAVPEIGVLSAADLVSELRALGVSAGQTLLVHASLHSLGRVDGGANTVVAALLEAVGPTGNIVVATGTDENSTTSLAHRARIAGMTPEQVAAFRNRMPAFDRQRSITRFGRIAEAVRTTPGAVRSNHPQTSFAALGPGARELMNGHAISCHLGLRSPLGRLYELDSGGPLGPRILMLGVSYSVCSALHLAEYLYTRYPPGQMYFCVTTVGARRRWTAYRDVVLDSRDFEAIGTCLDKALVQQQGHVGPAPSRLIPLSDAVDYAAQWMRRHRS